MAIQAIQYLDDNGNVIPVYVDKQIHTYDEWNADGTTYKLNRTYSVSDDAIIISAYHGEIVHTPYVTHYNRKTLAFAFRNNSIRKYLYVHDDLYKGIMHYEYDYVYYTDINPVDDENDYILGVISLDGNDTYYFYKGYNTSPYTESLNFYPLYSVSGNLNHLWRLDDSIIQPLESNLYYGTTYLGLYNNYFSRLYVSNGYQLTFVIGANASSSGFGCGLVWGDTDIIENEVLDRLTIIYDYYYWEGVIVVGVKNPFINVYVPDDNVLSDFSYWLWSTSLNVQNFQKMIQDPFNAIVSLHAIYAPIPVDGAESIKLGNLSANGYSSLAEKTIITLNCGIKNIPELYNNVLDYDYTEYEIYLPYIGFRPLGSSEVAGSSVSVAYNIDICTGACVANVNIIKNSQNICMYTYSGNCAVQMPITGVNYSSVIGNMLGAALSVGTAVATGGATAPMAVGAVGNAVLNSRAQIQRSGSLGGNAGVLAYHNPYIIVKHPVPVNPVDYYKFYGYPAFSNVVLNNCTGYVKVRECHLSGINRAREEDLKEIESLLKQGVII